LAAILASLPAAVADPPFPPLPQGAQAVPLPIDSPAVAAEPAAANRNALSQLIYRSRLQQVAVEKAAEALATGHEADGLLLLQQVLDQPDDSFQWSSLVPGLSSSRRMARQILDSLPEPTLALYERLCGTDAERLLAEARASGDPSHYAEVARRYFHTSAGMSAADWQATRWLDRGRFDLASRAWQQLLEAPPHRRRITEAIRRKASIAQDLARSEAPGASPRPRGGSPIRTASTENLVVDDAGDSSPEGEIRTASASETLPVAFPQAVRRREEWTGSPPYPHAAWAVEFSDENDQTVATPLARWEQEQVRNQRPVAVSNFPLVVGPLVVVRDYDGIRAVNRTTGEVAWKYFGATSLAQAAAELEEMKAHQAEHAARHNVLNVLFHSHAGNAALGTLSSDGQRLYAVDFLDIRPRHASSARTPRTDWEAHGGREKVTRESNRLIALDLAPQAGGRHVATPVWTAGGSVGALNWFYRMDGNDDGRVTREEFTGRPEQFQEIDGNGDGLIRPDEADTVSGSSNPQNVLAGHFFLGPPLAIDGRLFAMTENDRQLNLVSLDAETGSLLWTQGIGYVDHPIEDDPFRYTLSCAPIFSGGVVVCPTQIGVLAAVDAIDGALLWAYYYGDEDASGPFGNWSYAVRRSYGHPGFPCEPQIHGDRLVYLPRQSDQIHCLDFATGRPVWKTPRAGAEYVGTVADGIVVVVGQRYCRGLSLANGNEVWSARLGMPSGRGVQIGPRYLVPLQEGRVATLDIATGEEIGWSARPPAAALSATEADSEEDAPGIELAEEPAAAAGDEESRLGNLVVSGEMILSVDSRRLVAFPQAFPLLQRMRREIARDGPTAERILLVAELESTLGHMGAAKSCLTQAFGLPLSAAQRSQAENLMRELLYRELREGHGDETTILAQLERFLRTPADRGRFLMLKTESQLRRNDFAGVLETTHEFADLHLDGLLPAAGDPTYFVSARSWIADVIGRFQNRLDDASAEPIRLRLDDEQQEALASGGIEELEHFLALYARWPQAAAVRTALARKLAARGDFQRAELLLLESRQAADPRASVEASRALVALWDQLGLPEEAASLWLESEFPRRESDARSNGRPLPGFLPPDSLTTAAVARAQGPRHHVRKVRITQDVWFHSDPQLAEIYAPSGRQFVTPPDSAYQLVDKGSAGKGEINIIDRLTGVVVGNVEISAPYSGSTLAGTSQVGHFVPLGSGTSMNGISLLERHRKEPAWSVVPPRLSPDADSMMVGPTGPTYCVFQAHRHLVVVDPSTGRVLWQRTDLDPHSGLDADVYRGIIGDEEVLVLFGFDRASYTVYRTLTGEELRRGKLDINNSRHAQERRAFGRMLFHFTTASEDGNPDRRMRLWDPLTDRFVIDLSVSDQAIWKDTPDGEIVVALPPNRLIVLDGRSGAVRVDLELEPEQITNLSQVSALRDHANYYISLQPPQPQTDHGRYYFYMSDTVLPKVDVRGELLAVDRETGRLVWTRKMPQRSLLRTPHVRLPFVIALSLSGEKAPRNRQSLLVEVLDAATGETIGIDESAMRDRILQFTYDHAAERIELRGQKAVITLEFGPEQKPLLTPPDVL